MAKSIDIGRGGKLAHFYKYLHTSFKRDFEGIRCSPMWLTYSWSFKKGQFCGFEGQSWNLFAGAWEKRDIRENVQDTGWKQGRRWQKILNSDFSPMDSSSALWSVCLPNSGPFSLSPLISLSLCQFSLHLQSSQCWWMERQLRIMWQKLWWERCRLCLE